MTKPQDSRDKLFRRLFNQFIKMPSLKNMLKIISEADKDFGSGSLALYPCEFIRTTHIGSCCDCRTCPLFNEFGNSNDSSLDFCSWFRDQVTDRKFKNPAYRAKLLDYWKKNQGLLVIQLVQFKESWK